MLRRRKGQTHHPYLCTHVRLDISCVLSQLTPSGFGMCNHRKMDVY